GWNAWMTVDIGVQTKPHGSIVCDWSEIPKHRLEFCITLVFMVMCTIYFHLRSSSHIQRLRSVHVTYNGIYVGRNFVIYVPEILQFFQLIKASVCKIDRKVQILGFGADRLILVTLVMTHKTLTITWNLILNVFRFAIMHPTYWNCY